MSKPLALQLAEAERAMALAKVFHDFRETEAHRVLCAHIKAMEDDLILHIVHDKVDEEVRHEMRGSAKILSWVRSLATAGANRLAVESRKITDLKEKIRRQEQTKGPSSGAASAPEDGLPSFGDVHG